MNKSDILIRSKYSSPGSNDWSFYAANDDGYIKYINERPMEEKLGQVLEDTKQGSYVGYMENRHGADTFTTSNDKNILKTVPSKSIIHDIVISYSDEYKLKNNVLTYAQTIPAFEKTINDFLKENNMDPNKYQWAVAHHSSNGHPHIHVRLNEMEPSVFNRNTGEYEWRRKEKLSLTAMKHWKENLDAFHTGVKHFFKEEAKTKVLLRSKLRDSIVKNIDTQMDVFLNVKSIINENPRKRTSYESLTSKNQEAIKKEFLKYIKTNESLEVEYTKAKYFIKNQKFSDLKKKEFLESLERSLINKFIQSIKELGIGIIVLPNGKNSLQNKKIKTNRSNYRKNQTTIKKLERELEYGIAQEAREIERAILGGR